MADLEFNLRANASELTGATRQVNEFRQAVKDVNQDLGGVTSGGSGTGTPQTVTPFASKQTPENLSQFIKGLSKDPRLQKAFEEFQGALYGVNAASTPQIEKMFSEQLTKVSPKLLKTWSEQRAHWQDEAVRQGIPSEAGREAFDRTYGHMISGVDVASQNIVKNNPETKSSMSIIGKYIAAGLIAQAITSIGAYASEYQLISAQKQQATGLGFNVSNLVQNAAVISETRMANEMRDMMLKKQAYQTFGQLGLGMIGGLGGLALGGGLPGFAIGSMIMGALGGGIGNLIGSTKESELIKAQLPQKQSNQLMMQMYPEMEQRVAVYEEYDRSRAIAKARFGMGGVTGRGLGYSDSELYQLQYQQSAITGKYKEDTFKGQLAFSRGYGYNPQEIFQASVATRYTGEEVGAAELQSRRGLSNVTGMNARMGDLINAMNQLSVVMTKSGMKVSERNLLETSFLPFALYGDTAKGRMGDMGQWTLSGLQGMFNQAPGSAGDAFLMSALKPKSLMEFELQKERGIYDKDVRSKLFKGLQGFGDEQRTFFAMQGLGIESPQLAKQVIDKAYNFNKDKSIEGYGEGLDEWLRYIDENTKDLAPDSEEQKKKLEELVGIGGKNTSQADKHHAEIMNWMMSTGGKIAKDIWSIQSYTEEFYNDLFPKKIKEVVDAVTGGLKDMSKLLDDLTEEKKEGQEKTDVKEFWQNLLYNWENDPNNMMGQLKENGELKKGVRTVSTEEKKGKNIYLPMGENRYFEIDPSIFEVKGVKLNKYKFDELGVEGTQQRDLYGLFSGKKAEQRLWDMLKEMLQGNKGRWEDIYDTFKHPIPHGENMNGFNFDNKVTININGKELTEKLDLGLQELKEKILSEIQTTAYINNG